MHGGRRQARIGTDVNQCDRLGKIRRVEPHDLGRHMGVPRGKLVFRVLRGRTLVMVVTGDDSSVFVVVMMLGRIRRRRPVRHRMGVQAGHRRRHDQDQKHHTCQVGRHATKRMHRTAIPTERTGDNADIGASCFEPFVVVRMGASWQNCPKGTLNF